MEPVGHRDVVGASARAVCLYDADLFPLLRLPVRGRFPEALLLGRLRLIESYATFCLIVILLLLLIGVYLSIIRKMISAY
jgi:hypothetical protein